jgi:hypothetical protein
MSQLNDALKDFEATEANLQKLERIWKQIETLLPDSPQAPSVGDEQKYRELNRAFQHVALQMPRIDGYELKIEIHDPELILRWAIDVLKLGEFPETVRFPSDLREQERLLKEYRFRLDARRRHLARQRLDELCRNVDLELAALAPGAKRRKPDQKMPQTRWENLNGLIKSIDTLIGTTVSRPAEWTTLLRHLHFGQRNDFYQIVGDDWPSVKSGLEGALFSDSDPIPVRATDLGDLVERKPTGPVATQLQWHKISDAGLERLIYNLIARTPGYENPEWLTHTNAPDRGRDVSAYRVENDVLAGSRRTRVIFACKHTKRVGLAEVSKLKSQMALWTPRVDELIIVTTGRFSTDAVQLKETNNQSDSALRIALWPESHLEQLLAGRPELIAEFNLRE